MPQRVLFSTREIEEVRRTLRERLQAALQQIGDAAQLNDETIDDIRSEVDLTLPALRRSEATITPDEAPGGRVRVTVSIPIEGDPHLFDVKPTTFTHAPPQGDLHIPGRSNHERLLRLTGSFPSDVSTDDIKSWATKQADAVQQWIDWLKPDVAMHNADVAAMLAEGVERRRAELARLSSLREGLEGGI